MMSFINTLCTYFTQGQQQNGITYNKGTFKPMDDDNYKLYGYVIGWASFELHISNNNWSIKTNSNEEMVNIHYISHI